MVHLKNGYTKENYNGIQELKEECYSYLGDEAMTFLDEYYKYDCTKDFCFNIGVDIIPNGASCIGYGDYYDDKDPMHIPQCNIWFCEDSANLPHNIGEGSCISAEK